MLFSMLEHGVLDRQPLNYVHFAKASQEEQKFGRVVCSKENIFHHCNLVKVYSKSHSYILHAINPAFRLDIKLYIYKSMSFLSYFRRQF